MAQIRVEINVKKRIKEAFGIVGDRFGIPDAKSLQRLKALQKTDQRISGNGVNVLRGELVEPVDTKYSPFGTPLFDSIQVVNQNIDYTFQYDPLVDFRRTKKITETALNNGDVVIETAGVEPIDITIRGVLWNPDGTFPEQELAELIRVFEENAVLDVVSRMFNYHQINSIYIKGLDTPALEGYPDTQPFVITARSVKAASLIISQNQI